MYKVLAYTRHEHDLVRFTNACGHCVLHLSKACLYLGFIRTMIWLVLTCNHITVLTCFCGIFSQVLAVSTAAAAGSAQ